MEGLTPDEEAEYHRQRRLLWQAWCWVTESKDLDRMALNVILYNRGK